MSAMKNWMRDGYAEIKDVFLHQLCIPGTHNSAASSGYGDDLNKELRAPASALSDYERKTLLGRTYAQVGAWGVQGLPDSIKRALAAGWAICQSQTVAQQLDSGIRYFDLRLFYDIWIGGWRITHNGLLFGPPLQLVIDELLAFVTANPGELILIDLGEVNYIDGEDHAVRSARLVSQLQRLQAFLVDLPGPDLPRFGALWSGSGLRTSKVLLCGQVPPGLPGLGSGLLLNNWREEMDVPALFTRLAVNACSRHTVLVRNALQPSWWKQSVFEIVKLCATSSLRQFNAAYLPQILEFMLKARHCLGPNFRPNIIALDFHEDLDFAGKGDALARLCFNLSQSRPLASQGIEAMAQPVMEGLAVGAGRDAVALAACGTTLYMSGGIQSGDISNREELYQLNLADSGLLRLTGESPWTKALAAYPDALYAVAKDRLCSVQPGAGEQPLKAVGNPDLSWGYGTFVRMTQRGDTLYVAASDKIYYFARREPTQANTVAGDWSWLRGIACLNDKIYAYRGDDIYVIEPDAGHRVSKLATHGWPSTFSLIASRRYLYLIFEEAFHRYNPATGELLRVTDRFADLRAGCFIEAMSTVDGGACLAFLAGTTVRLLFVREP